MIDASGITFSCGTLFEWNELVAVSGAKINAVTSMVTYITFDHECGEYLEINDNDPIFATIVGELHNFLDIPANWLDDLRDAPPSDGVMDIWKLEP